ncbi:hypothetical protein MMC18_001693 [Xylographa bjoerkii]|nr:hypothetical protein [Xylographa bjoerkii]
MSTSLTHTISSGSLRVLSETSLAILRTRGEPAELKNGIRMVSNSSYMTNSSTDSEATTYIPEYLESLETLHFLELNKQTADIVRELYLDDARNPPERASTLRSARRYVESVPANAIDDDDDQWWSAMQTIGEIIIDMFEMRYEFLGSLDDLIKTPSKGISRKVSRMGLDGKLKTQIGPAIPPRLSSQPPPLQTFSLPSSSSSATATIPARPESLPGCTMFLKGGAMTRLQKIHESDNSLVFRRIASTPPEDFSPDFRGVYLTKSHQVAWQYAQWAAAKGDGLVTPVGILYVAVPNFLLASSMELYGDDWRRWDFAWLVGPLCRQSNIKVEKMKDMAELQIWKLKNGETACQHFATNSRMVNLLSEHCIGKVWIEIVQTFGEEKGNS